MLESRNMKLRLLSLFCCLSFTLMASAQASGGQIRRPTQRHSSRANNSKIEMQKKTRPSNTEDKRPRTIPVDQRWIIDSFKWTLLSVEIQKERTIFYWYVETLDQFSTLYVNDYCIDNKTETKLSVIKTDGIGDINNPSYLKRKGTIISFKVEYPALPIGTTSIDYYKNSNKLTHIEVSNKSSAEKRIIPLYGL